MSVRLRDQRHERASVAPGCPGGMPPRLGHYERLGIDIHGVLNGPR